MRDRHIDKLIQDIKAKKFREGEGKRLTDSYGDQLKKDFSPIIEGLGREVIKNVKEGLKNLKMPDMPAMPEYEQQEIPAPIVNVPAPIVNVPAPVVHVQAPQVNIPETKFPEYPEFPTEMGLRPGSKPFPVIVADQAGKPINWGGLGGGATGGRGDFFTIKDIQSSTGASVIDLATGYLNVQIPGGITLTGSNNSTQILDSSNQIFGSSANPLNVAITSGASSSTKAQIGNSDGDFSQANPLPVVFSSSGSTASALIDSSGVQYSGSNPLPVVFGASATQGVNIVDSSGVGYSGSNPLPITGPVVVTSITNSIAASSVDSSGVQYSGSNPFPFYSANTLDVKQLSGSIDSVAVTSFSTSIAANITDSSGVAYSGSNPLPITGPVVVTSITNTIAAANVDSSGAQFSGSNPFPMTIITSATATVNAVIVDSGGVGFNGTNPVPVTLISSATQNINMVGGGNDSIFTFMARTTNPTAVADGADVRPKADKLGRQISRPIQVRDLIKTAYATLSTQAETTVLAGVTGVFNDLIMITATNGSASAWKVDIRYTVGGGVIHTMYVPANTGPVGFAPSVPYPAGDVGATWTATINSGADVSNANLFITGLFSQEI